MEEHSVFHVIEKLKHLRKGGIDMTYRDELIKAMSMLAEHPQTVFLGQAVRSTGTAIYHTIKHLPENKRIELPVTEEMQLGISTGLALKGFIPVSIYPRWDFLILATNQIVNHLDKFEEMSDGQFKPKVIIRTCVGSTNPLMPGPQHSNDYTKDFESMCRYINVHKIVNLHDIIPSYKRALESSRSSIVVEIADIYNTE